MKRREFVKRCATAVPAVAAGGSLLAGRAVASTVESLLAGAPGAASSSAASGLAAAAGAAGTAEAVDVALNLKAVRRKASVLPGRKTAVWSYRASVLHGGSGRAVKVPGSYLGPTLKLRKGERVSIRFANRLPEESVVHWHGLHVPEAADGHPRLAVPARGSYTVEFDVLNRAGSYWYHPHPHGRTGPQVYAGLAGLIVVGDDEDDAAGLPTGDYDVPLVIQDRTFDFDNQLHYHAFGPGPGGGMMMGMLGDTILVNGRPDFTLDVDSRPYRLRLLNGSNSRIYKLALSDGSRLQVIATDGGLLERPVTRRYVTLAPGERVELWIDFSGRDVGSEVTLRSLEFRGDGFGFGPMFGATLHQGDPFDVMSFRVARAVVDPQPLPARLSVVERLQMGDAVNAARPREFEYGMWFGQWTINGRTFQMEDVAADEEVALGTLEAWDLSNVSGGFGMMMHNMGMPHPVHLHGQQFQIVDRDVDRRYGFMWDSLADGFVDNGWKDTVLVMPGERVRILRRFDDYPGLFLQHCHNLEHEDMGMMRNFRIT